MKWFKKIVNVINSTCLCIRFPFLWPRNRFTGLHYNNYKLDEKIRRIGDKTVYNPFLKLEPLSSFSGCVYTNNINGFNLEIRPFDRTKFQIIKKHNNTEIFTIDVNDYFESIPEKGTFDITNLHTVCCWKQHQSSNEYVLTLLYDPEYAREKENRASRFLHIVIQPGKYVLYKVLRWLYNNPLQWIMCIPTYTELSHMDKGWRKAFGIQICKEIKRALIKRGGLKLLFAYRIMDIKEKYGSLRWYDAWGIDETYQIISKYGALSEKTCIYCGKPAKYITRGWISPYCEDCIGKEIDNADEINYEEYGKD